MTRDLSEHSSAIGANRASDLTTPSTPPLGSVINALPAHVAILDDKGHIVMVNAAWHRFAEENGFESAGHGVGTSYLDICDTAQRESSEGASIVAEGIRKLLAARQGEFRCEYACHSPTEQRWFQLCATCFQDCNSFYILLAHQNITEVKLAKEALDQSEMRERQRALELETVLQAVPAAVWIAHDTECHRITGNQAADELLRLPHGAESSLTAPINRPRHFKVVRDGRDMSGDELPVQRAARGAVVRNFENSIVFSDGSVRHLLGNASPLRDEQGQVRGAVSAFVDITERKEAEDKLRESEASQRLRRAEVEALLEAIPAPVWIATDAECRFMKGNQAAQQVLGGVAGQNLSRSAPELERPTFEARRDGVLLTPEQLPMQKAAATRAPVTGEELEIIRQDGSSRFLYGNAVPLLDGGGAVRGCVGVMMDITQLKQTEKALQEAQIQLERHAKDLERTVAQRTAQLHETIADLEAFSSSVSHDLRAPLRSINGFAEALREECGEGLTEQRANWLDRIIKSAGRMDRLITDLLAFSRMSRAELALNSVHTGQLLLALIQSDPTLQLPHADIRIRSPLPSVRGNETALTQCIMNLLGNAIKYVAPGVVPRIEIFAEDRGESVRLWFADNGIGIAPEHHKRIFGVFQRLHHDGQGTGLGLAVVKRAAERMAGKVGVESQVGEGSRFWIELPRL